MNNYFLVGAASDLGVNKNGASKGSLNIINNLNTPSIYLEQNKNYTKSYSIYDFCKNKNELINYLKKLYYLILSVYNKGYSPITIGGDHSIAISSALADKRINNNIGLVWIDAHTDYNSVKSTITGNLHGIPLYVLNGNEDKAFSSYFDGEYYDKSNTVVVGARQIDKVEKELLKKDNILVYSSLDIKNYGIDCILLNAIDKALRGKEKVHVSFDVDVIDPLFAPGVSVREKNGISIEDAFRCVEILNYFKDVISSIDFVEYNPYRDINNKTMELTLNLIRKFGIK